MVLGGEGVLAGASAAGLEREFAVEGIQVNIGRVAFHDRLDVGQLGFGHGRRERQRALDLLCRLPAFNTTRDTQHTQHTQVRV